MVDIRTNPVPLLPNQVSPNSVQVTQLPLVPGATAGPTTTIPDRPIVPGGGLQDMGTAAAPIQQAAATPTKLRGRNKIAAALAGQYIKEGSDTSPTDIWGGIARLGKAGIGSFMEYRDQQREEAGRAAADAMFNKMLQGGASTSDMVKAMGDPAYDYATEGQQKALESLLAAGIKDTKPIAVGDRALVPDGKGGWQWMDQGGSAGQFAPHNFKDLSTMRDDLRQSPAFKSLSTALPTYNSMVKAALSDDKYADLNLVYGLATIFDPGSVVREGEQVLVRNAQSLPEWLLGTIKSVNGKAQLGSTGRKALLAQAKIRVSSYQEALDAASAPYVKGIAGTGLTAADVVPSAGAIAPDPDWSKWTGGASSKRTIIVDGKPVDIEGD